MNRLGRIRNTSCSTALLCLVGLSVPPDCAWAIEVVSPAVHVFNDAGSPDALSRSVSIFGDPVQSEALARVVTAFNESLRANAVSRSVSVTADATGVNILAWRPIVLFNDATPIGPVSRSASVLNSPFALVSDAVSRSVTLMADGTPPGPVSRQVSVLNDLTAPADDGACTAGNVIFRWPPTQGGTHYRLEVATAATPQAIFRAIDIAADTFYVLPDGMENTTYFARKAVSFDNGQSYGDPSAFSDGIRIDLTSPTASKPSLQILNESQIVVFPVGSDQGNPIAFHVQVATDTLFGSPLADIVLQQGVQQTTVTVSPGATYYARCKAMDCAGNESAWSAASSPLYMAFLADLIVSSVQAAPAGTSGASIGLSWQIQNIGGGPTTVSTWTERVYLSPDTTLTQLTALGDFVNLSYLLPGESYGRNATVTLPRGMSGNHYFVVLVDANNNQVEASEQNNRRRSMTPSVITLQNYADLRVTNVGAADFAISGDSISVVWTVKNEGNLATEVGSWVDRVFLSPDSAVTYAFSDHASNVIFVIDEQIGSVNHNGILQPGQSYTVSKRFRIPYPRTAGQYYIAVATDWNPSNDFTILPIGPYIALAYDGNVYEYTEELSNWKSDATTILLPPTPDLRVINVGFSQLLTAGLSANISFTVVDSGSAAPPESLWIDRVYISPSPQLDSTAVKFADVGHVVGSVSPSAPGSSLGEVALPAPFQYSANAIALIPNGLQGTYYFHVVADYFNQVFENGADSNNVGTSLPATVILPPTPDLWVESVASPTTGRAGDSTSVTYRVKNVGQKSTAGRSWTDRIRLVSLDQNQLPIQGTERTLRDIVITAVIDTTQVYQRTETLVLPTNLAAGQYAFQLATDVSDAIYENTPDASNLGTGPVMSVLAYPPVDLVVDQFTTPPTATAGDTITVSWSARNAGAATTLVGWWTDGIYLSQDTQVDAGDILLRTVGKTTVSPLPPGGTYTGSTSVVLPAAPLGPLFLVAQVDKDNYASEAVETNNTRHSAINILQGQPVDLVVDSLVVSTPLVAGQPATVSFIIRNGGAGLLTGKAWFDEVYISTKPFVDGTAVRLKQIRTAQTLSGGQGIANIQQVQIPNYLAGSVFVIVRTDALNEVIEPGAETNNTTVLAAYVDGQPLTDLAVDGIVTADSVFAGEFMTVSWNLRNNGPGVAAGVIRQGVFLSLDQSWDAADPLIAHFDQTYNIAPESNAPFRSQVSIRGAELEAALGNLTGTVPGILPNAYFLIARADLMNAFRETTKANNTAASLQQTGLQIHELPISQTKLASVTGNGIRYYFVDLPDTADWRLTASTSTPGRRLSLYWDVGTVATPFQFQLSSPPEDLETTVAIPQTAPGRAYVALQVDGAAVGDTTETMVSIRIDELPLAIDSVTPSIVGNGDRVTMVMNGSRFGLNPAIRLINPTVGDTITPILVRRKSSAVLRTTWDLSAATLGFYDLALVSGGDQILLPGAVRVEPSTGYVVSDETRVPDVFRAGNSSAIQYVVRNSGNIDIPICIMNDHFSNNVIMKLSSGASDVYIPGAFAYDEKKLLKLGLSDTLAVASDSLFQTLSVVFYDVPPGETRDFVVRTSPRGQGVYSGSRVFSFLTYDGYARLLTQHANLVRNVVGANPTAYDAEVVAAAVDSVSFRRRFILEGWQQQEPLIADALVHSSAVASSQVGAVAARMTFTSSQGRDSVSPKFMDMRDSQLSMNSSVNLPCIQCPVHSGDCSLSDHFKVPWDPQSLCLCRTYGYDKDACDFWYRRTCPAMFAVAAAGVVAGGLLFGPALGSALVISATGGKALAVLAGLNWTLLALDVCDGTGQCPDHPTYSTCYCRSIVLPCDPNEIVGPAGVGTQRWIRRADHAAYRINFENDSTLATASARYVEVSCVLPAEFDLRSVELTGYGWGINEFNIPGRRSAHSGRVASGNGYDVDVVAVVDASQRKLVWRFNTIDPATGVKPSDPFGGFLPVNDSTGAGTGYVEFSLGLGSNVVSGSVIDVGASIVFDTNPPIYTNRAVNTVDAVAPTSIMSGLPSVVEETDVVLEFAAQDDGAGSGVRDVSIYSSKDAGTFALVAPSVSGPTVSISGEPDHSYSFYGVARDTAGNAESPKTVAEATVRITSNAVVWSGDLNNDKSVDEGDLLPLGLFFEMTGPPRDSVSMAWTPRETARWDSSGATYADANGDGVVNQTDLLAIGLSYGRSRAPAGSPSPPLDALANVILGEMTAGDRVPVQVDLDARLAHQLMGGAALRVRYEDKYLEPESITAGDMDVEKLMRFSRTDSEDGLWAVSLVGRGDAGRRELGAGGHLSLTLWFRAKGAAPRGTPVQIERINALVGSNVTSNVDVSVTSAFVIDRPSALMLAQNTPNPFAEETRMRFELPRTGSVSLRIFDVAGRLVLSPVEEKSMPAGTHVVTIDGSRFSSGLYFAELRFGEQVRTRKLLVLR